ncbi:MAG: class I SAM-dependent methyltransferase [Xanthobacteraceae bacterium]
MADQGTEGLLSPFLRQQRISAALPYVKGRVLDIGCGSGALAEHVDRHNYVGIDIDSTSIAAARNNYPSHDFRLASQIENERYDTIIALAVIEHVSDPAAFLATLKKNLHQTPDARIICTTPHPSMDWIHWVGSRVGLFSQSANDEHEELLGRQKLEAVGAAAELKVMAYHRFLFGANQIVSYSHNKP